MRTDVEILLVEDSQTQALQLQRFLEENGYRVSIAKNGVEALRSINQNKPTIVISDVVMPEMDGYELCRQIKSDGELRKIPVILLTTLSNPEDIIMGLECGADNFVIKPYDESFLISRILYILANLELRRDVRSEMGLDIFFAGRRHFINSDRLQILDLLFSTYESAVQKNRELERTNKELKEALETIKTLHGLIPICSYCKKIRNDQGYWQQIEAYIQEHSGAQFSHGLCPECLEKHYPGFCKKDK